METCDSCGRILGQEDWPFVYRSFGKLCSNCKLKAAFVLVKKGFWKMRPPKRIPKILKEFEKQWSKKC